MNAQGELNFEGHGEDDGYAKWLARRKLAAVELARRLGLPLDHDVEVWLVGGIRLRGKLRLQEEILVMEEGHIQHLGLKVGHVPFTIREMESCVRLD